MVYLSIEQRIEYAAQIRTLRLRRGLTQARLAAAAQISRQTLNTMEGGRTVPQSENLLKVLNALGIQLKDAPANLAVSAWLTRIEGSLRQVHPSRRRETMDAVLALLCNVINSQDQK